MAYYATPNPEQTKPPQSQSLHRYVYSWTVNLQIHVLLHTIERYGHDLYIEIVGAIEFPIDEPSDIKILLALCEILIRA